jgi:hypothetical protein
MPCHGRIVAVIICFERIWLAASRERKSFAGSEVSQAFDPAQ